MSSLLALPFSGGVAILNWRTPSLNPVISLRPALGVTFNASRMPRLSLITLNYFLDVDFVQLIFVVLFAPQ